VSERLDQVMSRLRSYGRTGVIPYVTIGFPSLDDTMRIVPALEKAGADVIELGVPYSDPLADGPTIQAASYRALQAGMDSHSCIAAAKQLREAGVKVPLLFMGYYNPILTYGIAAYVNDSADAGIDGLIVPDLPAEESEPLHEELHKRGMALIPMLAPTSTDERIALGVAGADGFVYCVSVTGVTGARAAVPVNLGGFIDRVRARTTLPIVVGFGVAERAHVEAIGKLADAAAVGSALINVIDSAPPEERASRAGAFIAALRGNGA
jgi:tryptophan synthase alpha chain